MSEQNYSGQKVDLDELAQMKYLDPEKAHFYIINDNFLCLDHEGETYTNIKLQRALPYKFPDDYISVQDIDSNEIALIRSLYQFNDQQIQILAKELAKRYFCPSILEIPSIKEKMGYLYFEVVTNIGQKTFALRDFTRNIRRIDDGARILITNVDGNRYQIDDVSKLKAPDFKRLEPYLF